MGHGELRVEFDGLLVAGDGLVQLALAIQRKAQVGVGFGVLGVEFDGLLEAGDGLVQLALGPQRSAQVVVGLRELRVEFDGFLVAGDGLVQLALVRRSATPRLLWAAAFRVEFDGLLVAGDGLVQLALVPQGIAQVVVGRCVGRGGGDGRLIPAQPIVHPVFLVERVGTTQRHQQAQVPRPPTHCRLQQLPPPLYRDRPALAQEGGEPRRLLQGGLLSRQLHNLGSVLGEDRVPDRIPIRVGIHQPQQGTHAGRLLQQHRHVGP